MIAVTSSIPGEGKTFVSINLGSVLAMAGKRTVLIGADLRKPKIFKDFELTNDRGLSTYLSGQDSADEIIQHTIYENLDVISGGPIPPNPSELIIRHEFEVLINQLKQQYEYIIIDTPPVLLVSDSIEIARLSDLMIYVIRLVFLQRRFSGP